MLDDRIGNSNKVNKTVLKSRWISGHCFRDEKSDWRNQCFSQKIMVTVIIAELSFLIVLLLSGWILMGCLFIINREYWMKDQNAVAQQLITK